MFSGFSGSLTTKCMSSSYQSCISRLTLVHLYPDEHNQEGVHHYSFVISLDRCYGSYNTLDYLSPTMCDPK